MPAVYYCDENDLKKWESSDYDETAFWRILSGYAQDALYDDRTQTIEQGQYMLVGRDDLEDAAYAVFSEFKGDIPPVDGSNSVYDDATGMYGLILGDYGAIDVKEITSKRVVHKNYKVDVYYNIIDDDAISGEPTAIDIDYVIHLVPNRKNYEKGKTHFFYYIDSIKVAEDRGTHNYGQSQQVGIPQNIRWEWDGSAADDEYGGAAGLKATWDAVPNADGYGYQFYPFWPEDSEYISDGNETPNNYASIFFQDFTNIRIRVRAFQLINGEKQYGEWTEDIINEDRIYELTQ